MPRRLLNIPIAIENVYPGQKQTGLARRMLRQGVKAQFEQQRRSDRILKARRYNMAMQILDDKNAPAAEKEAAKVYLKSLKPKA